jgi:hypothetical protein
MQHGDAMTRKGMGLGKFEPGGSVSLPRHVLPIRFREACAARQCLRGRSNAVDPSGSTSSKVWSGSGRSQSWKASLLSLAKGGGVLLPSDICGLELFCSLEVDEDSLGCFCVAEVFVAVAIRIIMTLASGRKKF